ncbi:PQQ-dependent sugar dehydrogenase, partial [Sphingomonas bacterium]|uniref:PQQ-dependent sugar dehydrogenase n=1 Tax=Sphingomonas bacterium TaxID=1895847 RepID=UPI0015751329
MRHLTLAALALAACSHAQVPAAAPESVRGNLAPSPPAPFRIERLERFNAPFAMAFLPNGSLLVTEKGGHLKLRDPSGEIADVTGVPAVAVGGQGGLLDIAVAPDFAGTGVIYLSYAEPRPTGSSLALARARLAGDCVSHRTPWCRWSLTDLQVIWRAGSDGKGGQFGAAIAFAPDGRSLFLSSGERQRFTPAQDPDQALGKIVHLTLDGKPWPGNPQAGKIGAASVAVI